MTTFKVSGLNHVTFAVSNLKRSIAFYRDILGCELRMEKEGTAYLEAGDLWLCLSFDKKAGARRSADYSHVAFDVTLKGFKAVEKRIRKAAKIWQENSSEGPSLYFLDPDGHKLELHVGTLQTRLKYNRQAARKKCL